MNNQHPIVPSFEIANQWHKEACKDPYNGGKFIDSKTLKYIATKAAQWGADQELEACCEWLSNRSSLTEVLRIARRPKPPSLKEQALKGLKEVGNFALDEFQGCSTFNEVKAHVDNIRRAIEALPND
jgi:hypothetical protein